jgi:hypothetical protein
VFSFRQQVGIPDDSWNSGGTGGVSDQMNSGGTWCCIAININSAVSESASEAILGVPCRFNTSVSRKP